MKKIKLLILVTLVGFLFSCEKETRSEQGIENETNSSLDLSVISSREYNRIVSEITSVPEATQVFSVALSKAISDNLEFREFCFGNKNANPEYFYENFVGKIANKVLFGSSTFKSFITPYFADNIKQLYGDQTLNKVLEYVPLLMFKISDNFVNIANLDNSMYPCVMYGGINGKTYTYQGKHIVQDSDFDPTTMFYMLAQVSENHILVNPNNLKTSDNYDLKDVVGEVVVDCIDVVKSLDDLGFSEFEPEYKIVRIIEDLQNVYNGTCGFNPNSVEGLNGGTYVTANAPLDNCHRDQGRNWNAWEGIQLTSKEALDNVLFNCNDHEETMINMNLIFAFVLNGNSHKRKYVWSNNKNVYWTPPTYEIIWVQTSFWDWPWGSYMVPRLNLVTSGYSNYVDFSQFVFANSGIDNNWTEYNQGDNMRFELLEVDAVSVNCTASQTYNVAFNFSVKIKDIFTAGGSYTQMVNESLNITGSSIIPLLETPYFYCDAFDENDNYFHGYGDVWLHLYCPILD